MLHSRWISDFLTNRTQVVRYHGVLSDNATVTCGLPQGTILGPLIFIAYINSASRQASSKRWKFVDDLNLLDIRNPSIPTSTLQQDLTDLDKWSHEQCMVLHPGKCKVLHIQFSKAARLLPSLQLNNIELKQVEVMRILGVFLQANLKWDAHVEHICNRASQRMYLLRRLKHFHVSKEDLVTVYTCYVRPITEYAAPVWYPGLTSALSRRIEKIQRRAVRIILGTEYTGYTEACTLLGLPSLHTRRSDLTLQFAKSLLTSKLYRHFLPPIRENISSRQTRSSNKLNLQLCRTDRFRNSAIPYMTRMMNDLLS
ncbi:hypothetical protein Bbelb_111370 [Branchiostoma belcheri]|nr:hypothetical protein Bbelb_111370 [Branchiostoma belcheri]